MRHKWGDPVRFEHKTERECTRCGLLKVHRCEDGVHWDEFWRGLDRVETKATPPCPGERQ